MAFVFLRLMGKGEPVSETAFNLAAIGMAALTFYLAGLVRAILEQRPPLTKGQRLFVVTGLTVYMVLMFLFGRFGYIQEVNSELPQETTIEQESNPNRAVLFCGESSPVMDTAFWVSWINCNLPEGWHRVEYADGVKRINVRIASDELGVLTEVALGAGEWSPFVADGQSYRVRMTHFPTDDSDSAVVNVGLRAMQPGD